MGQSRIFTDGELKAMEKRKSGDRYDKDGMFHGRVKPKILELFTWFKRRKELKELIK